MMHFPPCFILVINSKFLFPPIFAVLVHFPYFAKIILSPFYFFKFHSDFVKLTCFYMPYVFFVPPCFDHDAFMHHTMHVLDAPEVKRRKGRLRLSIRVSLVITHKFHL